LLTYSKYANSIILNVKTTYSISFQLINLMLLGFLNHLYLAKQNATHCLASLKCSAKLFLNKQNNKSQKKP